MAVIHISQEEAERDFASVLKRLDAGTSVVIEKDSRAVATLQTAFAHRTVEETIALLPDDSDAYLDDEFAEGVLDFIERHRDATDLTIFD